MDLQTVQVTVSTLKCPPELEGMTPQTHPSHRTWRNQAGAGQEASSLLAGFHSAGRCSRHAIRQAKKLWLDRSSAPGESPTTTTAILLLLTK